LKKGLLKHQNADARQIKIQMNRARKDLETARALLSDDAEWAASIAYHAMLRMGRALLFSRGYLPAGPAQHRTVVELTGQILGDDYHLLVETFERMRRRRNIFFYDSDPYGSHADAENAIKTASRMVNVVSKIILPPKQS